MANQWVRLWVDMPNDPKWRVISKLSKQPISLVISVYVHLLTLAANANERGRTQTNEENIACALDCEIDDIKAIFSAMQGRVLDGDFITGWDKRQPLREDGSAERSKAWREKKKSLKEERTQTNASERKRTLDKDKDKDIKDKESFTNVKDKKKGHDDLFPNADVTEQKQEKEQEQSNQQKPPEPPEPPEPPKPKIVVPYKEIEEVFHNTLPELSQIYRLTEPRRKKIKKLWVSELPTLGHWERYFRFVRKSDFLMGRVNGNRGPFNCSIDFLINPSNYIKICENRYHGK